MAPRFSVTALDARAEALAEALASERQLIDELIRVMLYQRAAVDVDDLHTVNDSIFATHRLLLTLGEARTRRRGITRLFGHHEELGVKQLEDALGEQMTPRLRTERNALQNAACRLSREIDINRRTLRGATINKATQDLIAAEPPRASVLEQRAHQQSPRAHLLPLTPGR